MRIPRGTADGIGKEIQSFLDMKIVGSKSSMTRFFDVILPENGQTATREDSFFVLLFR